MIFHYLIIILNKSRLLFIASLVSNRSLLLFLLLVTHPTFSPTLEPWHQDTHPDTNPPPHKDIPPLPQDQETIPAMPQIFSPRRVGGFLTWSRMIPIWRIFRENIHIFIFTERNFIASKIVKKYITPLSVNHDWIYFGLFLQILYVYCLCRVKFIQSRISKSFWNSTFQVQERRLSLN